MSLHTVVGVELAIGIVALYTLVTAARYTNDGALSLARYYDVPDELIGMTVIAIGTSIPEISSHLVASVGILGGVVDYQTGSAVVLGGNMGSSTTQQTLLFGVFIVAFGKLQLTDSILRGSYYPMLVGFVLTLVVVLDGVITRIDGVVLLGGFIAYTAYSYRHRRRSYAVPETASTNVRRDILVTVGGLGLVLLSATLLFTVAETIVDNLTLGGSMIGVITLGLGAALPELSTVLDAVRRRAPNIALGTLFGSNVVNPLFGIGLGGAISGYSVPDAVILWDLPFKIVVGIGVLAYARSGRTRAFTRREGGYCIVLYFLFIVGRLLAFPAQ